MRQNKVIRFAVASALAAFALGACQGSDITGRVAEKVVTHVDPASFAAGGSTKISCTILNHRGETVEGYRTTFNVTPTDGFTVSGTALTATRAGTYTARCQAPVLQLVDNDGARFTVTPGAPVKVTLRAKPQMDAYGVGQLVTLYWVVTDADGNEILNVPGVLTAPTANVTLIDARSHRYSLDAEGRYTFHVQLKAPLERLGDDLTLTVDQTGPEIVIDFPKRGATLEGTGGFVTVRGHVTDAFGEVADFKIDGDTVHVNADGTFQHKIVPYWGVNIIMATAIDSYGNPSKLSPTFQYSSKYLSYVQTDAKGVKEDDGLEVLLGQKFLDHCETTPPPTAPCSHDPAHITDLATLVEVVLNKADLQSLLDQALQQVHFSIPLLNPSFNLLGLVSARVTGTFQFDVQASQETAIGAAHVTLQSRVGGIDAAITLGDDQTTGLDFGLEITGTLPLTFRFSALGLTTTFSVTPSITLSSEFSAQTLDVSDKVDISKTAGNPIHIKFKNFAISLGHVHLAPLKDVTLKFQTHDLPLIGSRTITFQLSQLIDLNRLAQQITDPLVQGLTNILTALAGPIVEQFGGQLLQNLFASLELQQSFTLPALLGPRPTPSVLDFYTDLDSVQFTKPGGQIGLGLGLYSKKGIARNPLGAIQRDGCLGRAPSASFSYGWSRSLGGAIKTDSINSLLFAIWWSGYLNGPLDAASLLSGANLPIPLSNLKVDMTWLLPPTLNDCSQDGAVNVEVGDLLVNLDADVLGSPISATLYIDASVALTFSGSPQGLSATVGDFKFFDVEVMALTQPASLPIDLHDLLENQLGGILSGVLVGKSLGPIALPPIDLGTLLPGAAASTLQFGNLSVEKQDGYLVIGGDLQ